jgi:hypothetical protein
VSQLILYEPPFPIDKSVVGKALEPYRAAVAKNQLDEALLIGARDIVKLTAEQIDEFRSSPARAREKLAVVVPSPRVHQVRYAGGLAAHRNLRRSITPTPRQRGIETSASPLSSRWGWARLLKRVLAIDLERSPRCQSGSWRIISAITYRPVIRRLLSQLKLTADSPLLTPAHLEQGHVAWTSA